MDQPTVEPLITVVLPVRDRADLLPRTLRSIQHQTLRPLRVVIADNGSTDAAPRIIAEWKERVAPEGISVKIVSEPRPGAARARNAALAMVDTPFTLHFDSDDEMLPDHLAQVDAWLRQHPDTDLLRWDVSILDDDGWTTLKSVGDDNLLRGQRLFTASADWFDGNGTDVAGLRHIEVRVDSVVPGNHLYPAAVCFTVENPEMAAMAHCSGQQRRFYMSVGGSGVAARTFDRLFSIRNPRRQYPSITDEVWNLIIQSKVQSGMTRDECRLALGSPNDIRRVPTHSGMREIWTYSDGVYFVFDEGLLSDFRL